MIHLCRHQLFLSSDGQQYCPSGCVWVPRVIPSCRNRVQTLNPKSFHDAELSFLFFSRTLEGKVWVQGALWQRKGWKEMDKMRAQLEDLRELRDLVRSLGRGGGWGPLRRAPVQYLDMKGRPGLLRTILEQQETRGLTRSDDISRLLPSEVRPSFFHGGLVFSVFLGQIACVFG